MPRVYVRPCVRVISIKIAIQHLFRLLENEITKQLFAWVSRKLEGFDTIKLFSCDDNVNFNCIGRFVLLLDKCLMQFGRNNCADIDNIAPL